MNESDQQISENAQAFFEALKKQDTETAGRALAVLVGTNAVSLCQQFSQVLVILHENIGRHAMVSALKWVQELPGAATVLPDLLRGMSRLENGRKLREEN